MFLKTLKLKNFRQFKGEQEITFADTIKNVTVIMGENGSGKTTLAQSFTWCLYGDTDFSDKIMLNKNISNQMQSGKEEVVKVELILIHNGIEYTIIREQKYRKDNGSLRPDNATFAINYKQNDGQQQFVNPIETDQKIKQILPRELSKYFFFDGERIGNMSKEVVYGKSKTLAEATRGLLGLNALLNALEHLNPRSKYSVIGSYNESYDPNSDIKVSESTKQIIVNQDRLEKIDNRIEELDKEMQFAKDRCKILIEHIQKYADSENVQKEKENYKNKLINLKKRKDGNTIKFLKDFNNNAPSFFAKSLIKYALDDLSNADKLDKGIPDMNTKAIDFLIKRGECICGTKLEIGNEAQQNLEKIKEFLPPHSIGISIARFVKDSESFAKNADNFFETIKDHYASIRQIENEINETISSIQILEEKLKSMEHIGHLQQELMEKEKKERELLGELNDLNREKGAIESDINKLEKNLEEMSLKNGNNRKIEIYKAYASYIYNEIKIVCQQKESEIRQKLEKAINDIFKTIYQGGMGLTIDEKYNIQVIVNESNENNTEIETSTAQSISVIFAFISGIIKLARENSKSTEDDDKMLESEPYPLVMDAPLSAFDKRRIKTVCSVIPEIAEQVIIFIKDTDGEIAEEHLSNKIGTRYMFDKKNELETYLVKR